MSTHQVFRSLPDTRLAALLALSLLFVCGCAGGGSSSNEAEAGASDIVEVPVNSFAAAWHAKVPLENKAPFTRLALNDDKVFAVAADNHVYWLSRAGGHVLATTEGAKAKDTLYEPVTLAEKVIFPSTSQLIIHDRKGKRLFSVDLRYSASGGAAGDGRYVFFGTEHPNGGRVAAQSLDFQPYPVSPEWELMTRGQITAAPAAYQGMVFAGSRDGGVYAVRTENRNSLWPGLEPGYFRTGGPIKADLRVDKDGVYAASTDSKLYCLDMSTGRIKWAFYAGKTLEEASTPVPTANMVYIYVPGDGLVAIDKAGRQEIRKPKWIYPEGRKFLASDERFAYVLNAENRIVALDKATGQVKFTSTRTDLTIWASNPSAKDSTIYAAKPTGEVYAIKAVLRPGTVGEVVMAK